MIYSDWGPHPGGPPIGEKQMVKKRGFALMTPERQREIAVMGGKACPNAKRSFSINRELAVIAGGMGGRAVPAEKRSFHIDRSLAARAGSLGGKAVLSETRSFARDPELAAEAGRKGGSTPRKS